MIRLRTELYLCLARVQPGPSALGQEPGRLCAATARRPSGAFRGPVPRQQGHRTRRMGKGSTATPAVLSVLLQLLARRAVPDGALAVRQRPVPLAAGALRAGGGGSAVAAGDLGGALVWRRRAPGRGRGASPLLHPASARCSLPVARCSLPHMCHSMLDARCSLLATRSGAF